MSFSYATSCGKILPRAPQILWFAMAKSSSVDFISCVAIDLGGKNTGVLLAHGKSDAAPHQHERRALTLSYPEAGLNLSQKTRLAKRHQRRGFKRRRLSKRLLQLMLRQIYQGSDEEFLRDFNDLRTFLNRRGYTYLTLEDTEEQAELLNNLSPKICDLICEELERFGLDSARPLMPQLEKTPERDTSWYSDLIDAIADILDKKNYLERVKNDKKDYEKALHEIRNYADRVLKAEKEGHKTRRQYLENIRTDLLANSQSLKLARYSANPEQIANLIGHVANLQLRVLRRYFNDQAMQDEDYWIGGYIVCTWDSHFNDQAMQDKHYWNEDRLTKIFTKHLRSWHVSKSAAEYKNREKLFAAIKEKGLWKTFLEEDPALSIPPFEDQNNRRVPRCRSLHLDETALDKEYRDWREFVSKIVEHVGHEYELDLTAPDLQALAEAYEKSAGNGQYNKNKPGKRKGIHAILLQRILDRSKEADRFHLRTLCQVERIVASGSIEELSEGEKKRYESGIAELKQALGSEASARQFVELAGKYYDEVERAKRGLWLSGESQNICYRCDRKPRQKKNIRHELIGHILGVSLPAHGELWQQWENLYRSKGTVGRKAIASVCRDIEEKRKDMGDLFHVEWNRVKYARKKNVPIAKNDEMQSLLEQTESAAQAIGALFRHSESEIERYKNPYSLAQIYNIMDGDIGGFQTTCTGCTGDNFWRSSRAAATNEQCARAVRLPADTMRPFDGYLARYLDRIAAQVVKEKWRQIEQTPQNCRIHVPILLEHNRFRFNADLAEMKEAARKKQALEKAEAAEKRSADKKERIRRASKGVCPYTGANLAAGGEIDHILPRSYSKSAFGAIFNSEMNLIYCSAEGNRKKGDKQYRLENLHDKYLQAVYKTTDRKKIREIIKETLSKFSKDTPVYFSDLEANEQRDFRHALFDDELCRRVRPLLNAEYKMRVSGMQGYLARIIFEKLKEKGRQSNRELTFSAHAYDADAISVQRGKLETHAPAYAKPKDSAQAPGSHVIDATMIWAEALLRKDIPGLPSGLVLEGDALEELLPESLQIRSLKSRKQYRRKRPHTLPIFKVTIYAERYLSFIVTAKECGFGYDAKNRVLIPNEHAEAIFELLKPFVRFRGEQIDKNLSAYRAMLGQKRKFIYFNVNRQAAARLQEKIVHKEAPTDAERNQLKILQGIRYFTLKAPVLGAMTGQGEKAVPLPQKKLDAFSIKVDFGLNLVAGKRATKIAGQVNLPQRDAWERVVADKLIRSYVENGKKWTDLSDAELKAFYDRHFRQTVKNPLRHHGVRKVYSLPMLDGPSGGIRIHRRHGTDEHFQVQATGDFMYAGFATAAENADSVDFSKPAMMPFLQQPTLTPVEGDAEPPPQRIVFMDEWRSIPLEAIGKDVHGIVGVWMSPSTKPRRSLRLKLKSALLLKDARDAAAWVFTAPLAFNIDKPSKPAHLKAVEKKLSQVLQNLELKPRKGKIQLYAVDRETTTIEFTVEGAQHSEWFQAGSAM
jgi:hypothetical protein